MSKHTSGPWSVGGKDKSIIYAGDGGRMRNGIDTGMSLRDYFAAKAMQGLLSAQIHGFNDSPANGPFASIAYEMADAMLKARDEG